MSTQSKTHIGLLLFFLAAVSHAGTAQEYGYTLLAREAHDPNIFTQGFVLEGNRFYESSGHYGRSFVVRYPKNSENPEPEKRLALPRNIFAEGITIFKDRLYLLSWKAGKAWALDTESLQVTNTFSYTGEGWGLTHDGERLILSDGSDMLRIYSEDFQLQDTIEVRMNGRPVKRLNELEYHDGLVWANKWHDTRVFAIDRHSGAVRGFADLKALHQEAASSSSESVLNGIAYDREANAFWVTGKYWRYRYLVRFHSL